MALRRWRCSRMRDEEYLSMRRPPAAAVTPHCPPAAACRDGALLNTSPLSGDVDFAVAAR